MVSEEVVRYRERILVSIEPVTRQGPPTGYVAAGSDTAEEVAAQERQASAMLEAFDGRLVEAERRIDRVLARLGVE